MAVIGLGVALVLGGLGAVGYRRWSEPVPDPPPPAAASDEAAQAFVASDKFNRLPMDQRISWLEQRREKTFETGPSDFMRSLQNMDESTRRRLHENMRAVMQERMNREVDAYHKLPESQRTEYLDKRIDEMERARSNSGGPRGPGGPGRAPGPDAGPGSAGPGGGPPPGPGGGPGRRMVQMARMPADRRARIESYMRAMGKRMAERGIGPPSPPPGPPR